ncbi:HPr-rel-A system PqqD family peptide chaperone [Massilia sp. DD77]|uniref:HPr-rel-A system PqqD family peptide chaperone n=1 Tax=Massilia sp. DD77 TaxID=3109349 RepID=UPI0030007D2B
MTENWRVVPGQKLAWREWDDEAVVFNDLSGATHMLSLVAVEVLDLLRAAPRGAADLAALLTDPASPDPDADHVREEVDALLRSLAHLYLIEPC